jgi:hypothetical protein
MDRIARELLMIAKSLVGFGFDKKELLDDWIVELGNKLPGPRNQDRYQKMNLWAKSTRVKKDSEDRWVVTTILKDGTKIVGIKPWKMEYDRKTGEQVRREWRGQWIVYLDGKKIRDERSGNITRPLEEKLLDRVDRYATEIARRDWYYQYSDDHRYWVSGEKHTALLKKLYSELSLPEKRSAYEVFLKEMPGDWKAPSFNQFEGA